jgi:hypothetical integral membrane protein (TIGR02206 family)
MGTSGQYWVAVAIGGAVGLSACIMARRFSGRTATYIGRGISVLLAADAVTFSLNPVIAGDWTARSSLPLALCDVTLVIGALACWLPNWRLGVELTYFWGLAGTLQAVLTPDLSTPFPQLGFIEFTVGHLGIVIAAMYLVVGLGLRPRRGSVPRVFAITVIYTACVGVIDWLTGANYMYLANQPAHASLLSLLGPWPWYIASAAGVAIILLLVLDAPFRHSTANTHRI